MLREVMWSAWDGLGLGHLRLAVRDGGAVAVGMILSRPHLREMLVEPHLSRVITG